jgi:hypothetical protein
MVETAPAMSAPTMVTAEASRAAGAHVAERQPRDTHVAVGDRMQFACRTAQKQVRAAEESLRVAQARLGELDIEQDEAVDALARTLIGEGQSRSNPLAALGLLGPAALMALPVAEKAKAIHQLVAGVQRSAAATQPTLQATWAAEAAACAVEQALARLDTLEAAVHAARHGRDALARTWTAAVAAFKLSRRASNRSSGREVLCGADAATFEARIPRLVGKADVGSP